MDLRLIGYRSLHDISVRVLPSLYVTRFFSCRKIENHKTTLDISMKKNHHFLWPPIENIQIHTFIFHNVDRPYKIKVICEPHLQKEFIRLPKPQFWSQSAFFAPNPHFMFPKRNFSVCETRCMESYFFCTHPVISRLSGTTWGPIGARIIVVSLYIKCHTNTRGFLFAHITA